MGNTNIKQVRVVRYAPDGGYAAIEWLRAFETVEIPHAISDGDTWRIGVQITTKRVIDVILRVEKLDGLSDLLRARLGRTAADQLYRHPNRCRAQIEDAGRPLALLGAKHLDRPVRILVCAAKD